MALARTGGGQTGSGKAYRTREFQHPGVAKAKGFAEQNLACPIKTRKISKLLDLSETHFCRIFREETGKTFLAYVNELRMGAAMQLLTGGTMRVLRMKEIANGVGFSSVSHFNHKFRQHFGVSPSQYRAKIGQGIRKSNKLSGSHADPGAP
jgi:AraC-like DNA-binding protein